MLGTFLLPITASAATDKTLPMIKVKLSTEEPTNQSIKVTVKVTDKSGITKVKYATGKKTATYFKTNGKALKLSSKGFTSITVKKNGTYSIYAIDKAGNVKIYKLTVSNIDLTVPTLTLKLSKTTPVNTNLSIAVEVLDSESGVSKVQYLDGELTEADFADNTTATIIKLSKNKGKFTVSKNGIYTVAVTDKAGNISVQTIKVSNIDKDVPTISADYTVMNQTATVSLKTEDKASGVAQIFYLKGKVTDIASDKWKSSAKEVVDLKSFTVNSAGDYSILAIDTAGNKTIYNFNVVLEMRAMWISYLEFDKSKKYTESQFQAYVDKMFDNCVKFNMNSVIVQVRPMGDAMYKSDYFPWSAYASGTQGVSPGYDPLEYMVSAAHDRGLEIHAWINPYRVSISGTDIAKLSTDNQARKWRNSTDSANKRNVLSFNSKLYYNPSSTEVQNLLINGVKEIVSNYDVDGIHFDDYFYPSLGTNYKTNFDAAEYVAYVSECTENGTTPDSIVVWRRNNVSTMVKKVYSAIKKIDPQVKFGISPAGNISNLKSSSSYYVDIEKWLSSSNYVDYICPQIYWSFENSTCPYDGTVDKWLGIRTSSTINMYIGIATYRAGSSVEPEWDENDDVLKRQILYGRDTGKVDGYMFFRYDSFFSNTTQKEVKNLLSILK